MKHALLVLGLALGFSVGAQAEEQIVGKALALDGDTILVTPESGKPVKVRLWGIDAPEMKNWPWGPWARGALDRMLEVGGGRVTCLPKGKSYKRIVATCHNGKYDLGKLLILKGRAVEYRRFSKGYYGKDEWSARTVRGGIWRDWEP